MTAVLFGAAAFAPAAMKTDAGKGDWTGRLGTFWHPLASAEKRAWGITDDTGYIVTGVFAGTAAEAAGIQPGDVIVEIDGDRVESRRDLTENLKSRASGDEVALVYCRRGERRRATVQLGPRPENPSLELLVLATTGMPWAQLAVAHNYRMGLGTKKDGAKARRWYQKAAEAGVCEAQGWLAWMLLNGEGGGADAAAARAWYEKAAGQGLAGAQFALGAMYFGGQAGARNYEAAARWFREASEQGHADAQYNLAVMLNNGMGVVRDEQAAFRFFQKAAEAGHKEAMGDLGNMYASGRGGGTDFEAAQRWLGQAAEAGVARAQHDLGAMYYRGSGVPKDEGLAAKWLHAAAAQGVVASQAVLGEMYWAKAPPDYAKAFEWLSKAADAGNPEALNGLGRMYLTGMGVPKDERKAFELQLKAAQAGHMIAKYNVGEFYANGRVVPQNYSEALKWLMPVADLGDAARDLVTTRTSAQFLIGVIYLTGDARVAKNPALALTWHKKAGQYGHLEAQRICGQLLRDRQEYEAAVIWLRAAAERGDRAAQNDLGAMYIKGWGVRQSREDGIAWLLRAYQQGSPTAKASLRLLGVDVK